MVVVIGILSLIFSVTLIYKSNFERDIKMNFLEALNSGQWVKRPTWAAGTKMRFLNGRLVFKRGGVEAVESVGADTVEATDFAPAAEPVAKVTEAELVDIINEVMSTLPAQRNRASLTAALIPQVIDRLTFEE